MESAVVVEGLRKVYGSVAAVDGLDLEIPRGEVFGLLGPNGAGKTTTVEILEGFRSRTAGNVRVLGVDPGRADAAFRVRVGVVFQSSTMFDQLTVREAVAHFAAMFPRPLPVDQVIEMIGLAEKRNERCGKLSGGQKRKVDLALGIVGDPELVFLDEPTTGLDPQARRQLWEVVGGFAGLGKTILLTTHYLEEAEHLAARVGVIIGGKLAALGPPGEIGGESRKTAQVSFRLSGPLASVPLHPTVPAPVQTNGTVTYTTDAPTALVSALGRWGQAHGVRELPMLQVRRKSLEDVYLEMVADSVKEELL